MQKRLLFGLAIAVGLAVLVALAEAVFVAHERALAHAAEVDQLHGQIRELDRIVAALRADLDQARQKLSSAESALNFHEPAGAPAQHSTVILPNKQPGGVPFEFNGRTYYLTPLAAQPQTTPPQNSTPR
jgi:hypothetical protein